MREVVVSRRILELEEPPAITERWHPIAISEQNLADRSLEETMLKLGHCSLQQPMSLLVYFIPDNS